MLKPLNWSAAGYIILLSRDMCVRNEFVKIHYETQMEDLLAFHQYHLAHSPTLRRRMAWQRWGVAVMIFLGVPIVAALRGEEPGFYSFAIPGAMLTASAYVLLYPRFVRRRTRSMVSKLYSEGRSETVRWHEMELEEDGFITRSAGSEAKTTWAAIERIESQGNHTFIYLDAVTAHVIPHAKVSEGDLPKFLAEFDRRYRSHADLPAPGSRSS